LACHPVAEVAVAKRVNLKNPVLGLVWWLMSIIPATWEVKNRRIVV
jgi:uncharacterized membrane protein